MFRFTPSIDGNDSNQDGRLRVMPKKKNSTESLDISHNTNKHTHTHTLARIRGDLLSLDTHKEILI